jgi:hypothetical protein
MSVTAGHRRRYLPQYSEGGGGLVRLVISEARISGCQMVTLLIDVLLSKYFDGVNLSDLILHVTSTTGPACNSTSPAALSSRYANVSCLIHTYLYILISLFLYLRINIFIGVAGRLPLWSSGQSSCLQIQRSGFDSWRYQFFWEVVGAERGLLGLVSTIEELLGRKSSGSGLESREYSRSDPSRWPPDTIYQQKVGTDFTDKQRSLGRLSSFALTPRYFL